MSHCDHPLRSGDNCGMRPAHRGQHRGRRSLRYCDNCDRPMTRAAANAYDQDGGVLASVCFLCARPG